MPPRRCRPIWMPEDPIWRRHAPHADQNCKQMSLAASRRRSSPSSLRCRWHGPSKFGTRSFLFFFQLMQPLFYSFYCDAFSSFNKNTVFSRETSERSRVKTEHMSIRPSDHLSIRQSVHSDKHSRTSLGFLQMQMSWEDQQQQREAKRDLAELKNKQDKRLRLVMKCNCHLETTAAMWVSIAPRSHYTAAWRRALWCILQSVCFQNCS